MVRYKCNRCGKLFYKKSNFLTHKARKRPCKKVVKKRSSQKMRKYPCPNCDKTYCSKYNLERHVRQSCKVLREQLKNAKEKMESDEEDVYSTDSPVESDEYSDDDSVQENQILEVTKNVSCHTENVGLYTKNVRGPDGNIVGKKCIYCNKILSKTGSMNRHYKSCKEKPKVELTKIIDATKADLNEKERKLEQTMKQLKEKEKKLQEVEKEYFDFVKKVAEAGPGKLINNVNMFYIMNNYTEAYDYNELMDPSLSTSENNFVKDNGTIAGCFNVIKGRCIDNVDLKNRPFHCVDQSRNKYLLYRNNEWSVDISGSEILNKVYPKIHKVFDITVHRGDSMRVIDKKLANMDQIRELEKYGRSRILKELSALTYLKNNI